MGDWPTFPTERCVAVLGTSSTSLFTDSTFITIPLDTNLVDTAGMHDTAITNLTGTVSKTSGSATITGSGSAFTTDLSVGKAIAIPGTSTEFGVVTAIASNTSLTLNRNMANTASGQTARKANECIVIRTAGNYDVAVAVTYASNATGYRYCICVKNQTTGIGYDTRPTINGDRTYQSLVSNRDFAQYDFVTIQGKQNSGGALDAIGNASGDNGCWLAVTRKQ